MQRLWLQGRNLPISAVFQVEFYYKSRKDLHALLISGLAI